MRKWKTIIALILTVIATIQGWRWFSGIFFLAWAYDGLKNRETFFILESISRDENAILYWIIISLWFIFAIMFFIPDSWYNHIYWFFYQIFYPQSMQQY